MNFDYACFRVVGAFDQTGAGRIRDLDVAGGLVREIRFL
jgi:hypothetical protein